MHPLISAGLVLALGAPVVALAQPNPEVESLRQEIDAMRAAYEQRLQALEQRLQASEAAAKAAQPSATGTTAAAPANPAAPEPAVTATAPATATAASAAIGGGANAFNPAISLILSGTYTRTSLDPSKYSLTGFAVPPGAEIGPGDRGFSLAESELGFAASIDPWLRGAANIALHSDNSVSVEEAYIQTTSLGHGLSLKAGRFFSGIGYLNEQHAHTWDFVDAPLAYQAFLGNQFGDDGLQLRWLAPTDIFLEAGAEIGRGRGFPGSDTGRNGAGATALYAHAGGDVGESHSWRAGLSMLNAKATDLDLITTDPLGNTTTGAYGGTSRVWIADAVWKWAPNGNATRTNFKLQGEYLGSTRDGQFADSAGGGGPLNTTQSGWYLQGIYQFMPRWRVGLRTERLDSGAASLLSDAVYRPRKNSLMVDFSPSEFSRVRLQLARDESRFGQPDNQLLMQYQMSLGAHGAHSY
jgi:hypothetical protein